MVNTPQYAFGKQAEIEFPQEKVLWLVEQQVVWQIVRFTERMLN